MRMPFIYSIADYRANYFDAERLYTQPEDFEPNFCIKRGATYMTGDPCENYMFCQ
jgi:hypothetical protein